MFVRNDVCAEDGDVTDLSVQNKDIDSELVEKKKKLDKLKEKVKYIDFVPLLLFVFLIIF